MHFNKNFWRIAAGLNGFLAVAMGAIAAHAIADAHVAAMAEKASYYQLIHAAVLLWLAERSGKGFRLARWTFLTGLILFCGSLYLKALTGWANATTFAPLGGVSFMAGWLLIVLARHTD